MRAGPAHGLRGQARSRQAVPSYTATVVPFCSAIDTWRRWYRTPPPRRLSRDLLVRGIAYHIQEDAHGGLSNATRRRLRKMAKGFAETGRAAPDTGPKLRPGARLVREWRGKIHVVTVTEDGFEYGGRTHPSLTAVARQITGAHWSGPRFFGLRTSSETAHEVNHA